MSQPNLSNPAASLTAYPLVAEAMGLNDEGRFEAAAQLLIRHLRQYPDEPRGLAELGNAAMLMGALVQSEQFLRKAIARGAKDLRTRRLLASVINQQERPAEAERMFEALAAETGETALSGIRAGILDKLGRNEEALALQQQVVEQAPDSIPGWVALGHTLRSAGRTDDAVAAYRHATELDFEFGEAWWGLASIKRKVLGDDDLARLREALSVAVDERNIAPLHFALARALHDRGEHAQAFEHYAKGNQIRTRSIGYDRQELTDEIDETIARVDADYIARLPQLANGTDQPVFIVSLPRSGSTLLEQMLGSHPVIEPVGELPYAPALLRGFIEMATRRGKVSAVEAIAGMPEEVARRLGAEYLSRAAQHRKSDRPFFVDKLPHNWSNVLFIRRILPQARFVDIRRAPLDCCFSNFTQYFTRAHAASFALEDIGQCYVDYVRYMSHLDAVAPQLVHHVDYARLVADPRPQLDAALDYLGLDWDERVLAFHELERVVRTPSSEQVRRPLNRDGMEVWRPYEAWLGPLRQTLGELAAS